jgi:hypothetical protein
LRLAAGYGERDVEAYIEANAGNLGFDPGIDIPSDVVASYFDAPPVSYGPPSPAVSPAVSNSISLTPAGIAALAPSANVSSPANVFSPADYGPPSPIFDPAAEIQRMQAQRIEAERLRQIDLERPIVDPKDVYKTGINTTGVVNQQTDAERPIVDPNVESSIA